MEKIKADISKVIQDHLKKLSGSLLTPEGEYTLEINSEGSLNTTVRVVTNTGIRYFTVKVSEPWS